MTDDSRQHALETLIALANAGHDIISSARKIETMLEIDSDDRMAIGQAVRLKEMGGPILWTEIHDIELKRKPRWKMTVEKLRAHYEPRLATFSSGVESMAQLLNAKRDNLEHSILCLSPSQSEMTFGPDTAKTMSEAVLNFGERVVQEIPDPGIARLERRLAESLQERASGVPTDGSRLHRCLEFRKFLTKFESPLLKLVERQIKREFRTLPTVQPGDDSSRIAEVEPVDEKQYATDHSDTDGDLDTTNAADRIASDFVQLVEKKFSLAVGNLVADVRSDVDTSLKTDDGGSAEVRKATPQADRDRSPLTSGGKRKATTQELVKEILSEHHLRKDYEVVLTPLTNRQIAAKSGGLFGHSTARRCLIQFFGSIADYKRQCENGTIETTVRAFTDGLRSLGTLDPQRIAESFNSDGLIIQTGRKMKPVDDDN
jgi:hypothetical protein